MIVDDQTPLGQAVLIGFSLGLNAGVSAAHNPLEAALYSSPEHAGSMDYEVGPPSDLYSAGILLFECLTGKPPFAGDAMGTVLLDHMTSRVPDLRATGVDIPRPLDELIQRLLRKDPHDRYQTAEAVLIDLNGISDSLHGGAVESDYVVGLHDRRLTLTEPAFIGHKRELQQLDEQIGQVAAGHTSLVFLEGESGGGKTRFLAEAALHGAQGKMWVLHGRGQEMASDRPFQVLHGIVEDVVERTRGEPSFAETLRGAWAITPIRLPPYCRNWPARSVGRSRRGRPLKALLRHGVFRPWLLSSTPWGPRIALP